MKDQLLSWLLTTAITLGGAGVLALIVYGVRLAATKAKGTAFAHAMTVIDTAVEGAASRIRLELLPLLSKATALDSPGGRSITDAERAELLAKGVEIVRTSVAPSILAVASGALGGALDSLLKGKVETAVVEQVAALSLPASVPLLPPLSVANPSPAP